MNSTLFLPQYHDEVPLSKTPNPQLLHGRRSINGCPLLRVCVHGVCVHCCVCVCTLDGLKAEHEFRVWVTIPGRMSRHFHFHFHFDNAICICAVILISIKYIINYNSCYITYD